MRIRVQVRAYTVHIRVYMGASEGPDGFNMRAYMGSLSGLLWVWNHEQCQS